MKPSTRASVQERAGHRCEYCQLHQEDSPLAVMHVEHIIPRIHGGTDDLDNLALACIDCNLHKGPNLVGIDPETERVTDLFHPKRHRWEDWVCQPGMAHFDHLIWPPQVRKSVSSRL